MQESCMDVLLESPIILNFHDTLHHATEALLKAHVRFLPVIDDTGKFQGIFSSLSIIKLLLPQAVRINMGKELVDLNFMKNTLTEFKERYDRISEEPLAHYITRDEKIICSPNSSIMEVLLILYKSQAHAIVVEPETQKFIGVITIRSVIDKILSTQA